MDIIRKPRQRFATKRELVHHAIREAIMAGRLPPGARVVIDEVARRLEVSSIPVREAVHQLESEGLVILKPHVGPVVADVPEDAVVEIFALLEALELTAARYAVERRSDADLLMLRDCLINMNSLAGDDDVNWVQWNSRFHRGFAQAARLPRTQYLMRQVGEDWERVRLLRYRTKPQPDPGAARSEHEDMLQSLEQRDLSALEGLIRLHNRSAYEHYL